MTKDFLKAAALAALLATGSTYAMAQDNGDSNGGNAGAGAGGGATGAVTPRSEQGPGGANEAEGNSVGQIPLMADCPEGYAAKDDGTCADAAGRPYVTPQ